MIIIHLHNRGYRFQERQSQLLVLIGLGQDCGVNLLQYALSC